MVKKLSVKFLLVLFVVGVALGGAVYTTEAWRYVYDSDEDGHVDALDTFPLDASEWSDMDGDGFGDNIDVFPKNPKEYVDSDGDHYGDNEDAFPNDPTEHLDSDGDGYGDNMDAYPNDQSSWESDSDGDGYPDHEDAFPKDPNEHLDTDKDGFGDNEDAFPNNPKEHVDSDKDGYGNNEDAFPDNPNEHLDSDGDRFGDNEDEFPNDPTEHLDSDNDGYGDNKDAFPYDSTEHLDSDGDGRGDNMDAFPYDPTKWSADSDGDGLSDEEEQELGTSITNPDTDGDTVPDGMDEHPLGGDRYITKEFKWSYGWKSWTWQFGIPSDVFDYYNKIDRVQHPSAEYVTFKDPTISNLAKRLEETAEENGYSKAEFATAFVQNLPYLKDTYTRFDEYPKFPIQTLVDGTGDCEDSSYLTAALIAAMNIDVILIHPEGHLGIGVWCDGCSGTHWESNGRNYYFLETTNPNWKLGQYPDGLSEKANIYRVFE